MSYIYCDYDTDTATCQTAVDACQTLYYTAGILDTSSTSGASYDTCLAAAACSDSGTGASKGASCASDISGATNATVSAALAAEYASMSTSSSGGRRNKKQLKSVAMNDYPYTSGVVIYGEDTINTSYPTYCDHYHLYSFYFDNVTPAGTSDTALDLDVHGWTMIGFPGMCTYTDWAAIDYPLIEDVDVATTGDQFAMTCGYYVQYEWSGYDDVYFEIDSMNAIARTVSAFALVAVSALFL